MRHMLFFLLCFPLLTFARDFYGYESTHDCSGHEAGYRWAERRGIDDPDDCSGNSRSFVEGCWAYAEEEGEPLLLDDEDDDNIELGDDSY